MLSFRPQGPHEQFEAQCGNFGPLSLGSSFTGLPSYNCYRQHYSSVLHNKQGWTHSHTLLHLVVDLFLGQQTQDIAIQARHIPDCLNVIAANVSRPNQPLTTEWSLHPEIVNLIFRTWGTPNSGHVCHNLQRASSPVYVSTSRASSTDDRCSVTRLAREVDVQFSTISPAHQSHSETMDHPGGQSDTNCPLVAITIMVFTSTTSVFGLPSHHSVPLGPTLTTGVCLRRQGIPSACMEALMQHYQAAGFLYYLFDTHGLSPQTIKGYRSCLASVLSQQAMLQRSRLRLCQT